MINKKLSKKFSFSAFLKPSINNGGGGGRSAFARLLRYGIEIIIAAFNVLKRYRPYFLSRTRLKIIIFTLLGKTEKTIQLKTYISKTCDEHLKYAICEFKNSCQSFLYFIKIYKQCQAWLNSTEFKEKYNKHPFPPYLNPKTLDYSKTNPYLAWDLNLPLPNNYKFIFLSTHGCGRAATGSYLKLCGVYYDNSKQSLNNKARYINYYNELLNPIYPNHIVHISEYCDFQNKFIALLEKKPMLMLLRDPVSNLKSLLNYPLPHVELKKDFFTLNDKDFLYFSRYLTHKNLDEKWFLDSMKWVLEPFVAKSLVYNLIEGYAIILQTNDVRPNLAFETFKTLAKTLNFDTPKESDKRIFETNLVQGMLDMCLPITLKIYASDFNSKMEGENFDICIFTNIVFNLILKEKKDLINIIEFLELKNNALSADLVIMIEKQHFEILQKDAVLLNRIKDYLKKLIESLAQQNENYKKLALSENDILNFLSNSKNCRKIFKAYLEDRVIWFKENRPDILASWKYYLEFENICQALD